MTDPVMLGDGHSYEKEAIEKWIKENASSPITGVPLKENEKNLVSNHSLRNKIQEFKKKQK